VFAENKTLVCRQLKEPWSKRDLPAADQIVALNYANHNPAAPMPVSGRATLNKHESCGYSVNCGPPMYPINNVSTKGGLS
jgi:hypothetical protein